MWGRSKKTMIEAGSSAAAFQLKNLNGTSESLSGILAKGPALLAFFKISCPVCQLAFPFIERLSSSSSFQVVGISQDDADSTKSFNQRFGVTFPTLLDPAREGYPASNAYGISSVPSLFLVEADGRVSTAFSGFSKRDLQALGDRGGIPIFQSDENVPEWKAG
jgi:peroxiredoxin